MAEQWPPQLQQYLQRGEFNQTQQDTNIRTNVETGPVKQRRRFTQPMTDMGCMIWVPHVDYLIFLQFYNQTLLNGTLGFDFDDPITAQPTVWRFAAPFTTSLVGGLTYKISMKWESLP
jgi:hypothetical protein